MSEDIRRKATAVVTAAALVALFTAPTEARQQPPAPRSNLSIAHDELVCVTTELAPKVDAGVAPAPQLQKGYVYFRKAGTEDYYYVLMEGTPADLAGTLPRPLPETKAIDYNVQALDVRQLTAKVGDFTPPVVVPGKACKEKRAVVVGEDGANLTVGLTKPGQSPVPPGFNAKDIGKVILVTGAVVGLAEAMRSGTGGTSTAGASAAAGAGGGAAAGGGGGSAAGWILGGAAVIGGGAAIIANQDGGGQNATATPTVAPTATPTPIPLRFVEVDATWSGLGDIEVQILNASNQSVGTKVPAGCGSTSLRTERVIYQPTGGVPAGTYRLVIGASTCGAGTPASIVVSYSVQAETGVKCASAIVNVSLGAIVVACQFNVP